MAIVNPMGAIPIFLSLCGGRSFEECRQIARPRAITVAVVLITATWAGDLILNFFGIGLLLAAIGFQMLTSGLVKLLPGLG